MSESPARRRIVVGVDGSLPSLFALSWAGREAATRGAQLCVVAVAEDLGQPPAPYAPKDRINWIVSRRERWRETGRLLTESITAALGPCPQVTVHEHVEQGSPARVLPRYTKGAELLVLGTHRRSGPSRGWFGPIVRGCLQSAYCPVVVVHPELAGSDRTSVTPDRAATLMPQADQPAALTPSLVR